MTERSAVMDEEAQKRNTDCVYFLASPLTCKKGNECEYRHSESARINPRHCWYWLSGNCLNPHCAFRHPPLEVHPAGSASDSSLPPGNANKNGVPCYFFFQGYCAKGDKCSFIHGPSFASNPGVLASQKTPKVNSTATETLSVEKKDTNRTDNGTLKSASVRSTSTEVQLPNETKCTFEARNPIPKTDQHTPEVSLPEVEYPQESVPEAPDNGINFVTRSQIDRDQPTDEWLENDMENEEWLEESSPGFDVLVDDGPEQLGYQDDVDYLSSFDMEPRRESIRGRERMISTTEELPQFDYEGMHDELGYIEGRSQYAHMAYDQHEEVKHEPTYDHVNWHKRKNFNDRDPDGAVFSERRGLSTERYSRKIEKADLRHRLTKRRRVDRTQIGDKSTRRSHPGARPADFQHAHRQRGNDRIYGPDVSIRRQQGLRHNNMRMQPRMRSTIGSFSRESYREVDPNFKESPENIQLRSSVSRNGSVERFRSRYKEKERTRLNLSAGAPSESSGFRRPVSKYEAVKNDIDFARPKSLEQIKEEKRRAIMLGNDLKDCNTMGEPKSSEQSTLGSQIAISKNQALNKIPGEERKISLGKVIVNESNKLPLFEGPKPLSALLKGRQKSNDDTAGKSPTNGAGELSQRSKLNGNSKISYIGGKVTVLPFFSQKDVEERGFLQEPNVVDLEKRPSYLSTKFGHGDSSFQNNGMSISLKKDRMGDSNVYGTEDDSSVEPLKIENGSKSIDYKSYPDEDNFGTEEEEDDDFAKKLVGFFH